MNREVIDICVKNIKVVHEDITDGRDKDFEQANRLLREAECIYYLGFGYGKVNMDRLNLRSWHGKNGSGTGLHMHMEECNSVTAMTYQSVKPQPGSDCIDLLRKRVDWS